MPERRQNGYEVDMVSKRIKELREQNKLTQAELARMLGITRSGVNAWELGIAVPSTQYLITLSQIFMVSTDFLLGLKTTSTLDVSGLTDEDIAVVSGVVTHLRHKNNSEKQRS